MEPMDYQKAPPSHLATWDATRKAVVWVTVIVAAVLGVMALTLT